MRRSEQAVTFDLVADDDERDEALAAVPPDAPGVSAEIAPGLLTRAVRAVRRLLAGQPRSRLAALAAVVALMAGASVGTTMAVDRAQTIAAERSRIEALLASPGGVRDVSGPLEAVWTVPLTGEVLGVLPSTVVVRDGHDAVGIAVVRPGEQRDDDAAAGGEEVWRHRLGEQLDCGPRRTPGERAPDPGELVCLSGPASARRVTVIDSRGEVAAARDLGDTSGTTVRPGPDGSLVTVVRTGDRPELTVFGDPHEMATSLPGGLTRGQGARVTVADAATGAARWTADLPFVPVPDVGLCGYNVTDVDGGPDRYELTLEAQVIVGLSYVQVGACGLNGAFLADGTRLPLTGTESGYGPVFLSPLPGGGFAFQVSEAALRVVGADGRRRFETERVAVPRAVDALYPQTLALMQDETLTAIGAGDEPLWSGQIGAVHDVVAEASGVALAVASPPESFVAFSLEDGSELWRRPFPELAADHWYDAPVTDGRTVVLAVHEAVGSVTSLSEAKGYVRLLGIDITTGERWSVERDGTDLELLSVGGQLVEYAGVPVSTTVELPDGSVTWESEGTLSLLAPGARTGDGPAAGEG